LEQVNILAFIGNLKIFRATWGHWEEDFSEMKADKGLERRYI
jgi:hypothetical protein